jgi:hypothetical protein
VRALGEVLGILPDSGSPSLAKRIVFEVMWLVYCLAGSAPALFLLFVGHPGAGLETLERLPMLMGIVAWVGLGRFLPVVPRHLRLGTIPALAVFLFLAGAIRAEKRTPLNMQLSDSPDCAIRAERDPPDEIYLDSLRLALAHRESVGSRSHQTLDEGLADVWHLSAPRVHRY